MSDPDFDSSEYTEAVADAHAKWMNRCLRALDPRDICYVVQRVRRGSYDEDLVLRGRVIGEWRVEPVDGVFKITWRTCV